MACKTPIEMRDKVLAFYPLNSNANDYSENARNGRFTGAVPFVPGVYGNAADFSGGGALVETTGFPDDFAHYTIAAWVNLKASEPVKNEGSNLGNIVGPLSIDYHTGKLQFFIEFRGTLGILAVSDTILKPGVWTHVIAMYDHDSREFFFFINGIMDTGHSLADHIDVNDKPMLTLNGGIGGNFRIFPNHDTFNGSISDVIIFKDTLNLLCINAIAGTINLIEDQGTSPSATGNADNADTNAGNDSAASFIFFLFLIPVAYAFVRVNMEATYHQEITAQQSDPHPPPPPVTLTSQEIADKIGRIVGRPAELTAKVSRKALGISETQRIHLDIGGLGYYFTKFTRPNPNPKPGESERLPITAGFRDAINVNDTLVNVDADVIGSPPPVPNLVLVRSWTSFPPPIYPFEDNFADYVTMQSVPLTSFYVSELARILRVGGMLGLWIDDTAAHRDRIEELRKALNDDIGPLGVANTRNGTLFFDEFTGEYKFPKRTLVKRPFGFHTEL
jgi:hypothetical protein